MNLTITKQSLRRDFSASLDRLSNLPSAMLMIVVTIYILPLSGALSSDTLAVLYGGPLHRGYLFLAAFLIWGAFVPSWRSATYAGGFIFVAARLHSTWTGSAYDAEVGRVLVADISALACLVLGVVAHSLARRRR
jgi:hypothetical protein